MERNGLRRRESIRARDSDSIQPDPLPDAAVHQSGVGVLEPRVAKRERSRGRPTLRRTKSLWIATCH